MMSTEGGTSSAAVTAAAARHFYKATMHKTVNVLCSLMMSCFQCFDAVGCVAGRASGL